MKYMFLIFLILHDSNKYIDLHTYTIGCLFDNSLLFNFFLDDNISESTYSGSHSFYSHIWVS